MTTPLFKTKVEVETSADTLELEELLTNAQAAVALVQDSLQPFRAAFGLSRAKVCDTTGVLESRLSAYETYAAELGLHDAKTLLSYMNDVAAEAAAPAKTPLPAPRDET